MRALSIRQPYVELILRHEKKEECHSWQTHHRGQLLLHASKTARPFQREKAAAFGLDFEQLERGALVGVVDIVGCRMARKGFAWELENPRQFRESLPYAGAAGMFLVEDELVSDAIETSVIASRMPTRGLLVRLWNPKQAC